MRVIKINLKAFLPWAMIVFFVIKPALAEAPFDIKELKKVYEQAIMLFQEGNYEHAIAKFQEVLRINPRMAVIHNLIGAAYLELGDKTQAESAFQMTLKHDPQNADAYYNLGSLYFGSGSENNSELAASYFLKAIEYQPSNLRALFSLGWIEMLERENPEKAAEYFEKVVELDPDLAEGYYGLGMAYLRLNRRPEALLPISKLRSLGKSDMALRIESVMKGEIETYSSEPLLVPEQKKKVVADFDTHEATNFQLGGDIETTY